MERCGEIARDSDKKGKVGAPPFVQENMRASFRKAATNGIAEDSVPPEAHLQQPTPPDSPGGFPSA